MKHLTTKQLVAYHEHVLPIEKQLQCEKHLQHCPSCRAEWEILQELDAAWHNPVEDDLSSDTLHAIMIEIEQLPLPEPTQLPKPPKKVRIRHILLAGVATFLFLQSDFIQYAAHTNDYVLQRIEQTSELPLWHTFIELVEGTK